MPFFLGLEQVLQFAYVGFYAAVLVYMYMCGLKACVHCLVGYMV